MAIIISGTEYYIVSQLTNHSVMYRQLCEQKPIKDRIIVVQERKLIEKNIFDRYVYLENNMVMETTICYQTNVRNDGKIVKILRNNYDYEIEDGIYYYSKENSTLEIDFIIQKENVYPLEVKAEENLSSKSLKTVYESNHNLIPCRFSMADYREEEWITNVPLYLVREWGLNCE